MKLLVFGGTVFLGRHVVDAALAAGCEVTLLNRGNHVVRFAQPVEQLQGDRDGDLSALVGRYFDAVIDCSGYTPEQLAESDAEFLILLRAIDDTFSQMVHTRYSYRYDEILWGRKFRPMFNSDAQGDVMLDLNQLDETDEVPLN
jgi:hypothetical protein